MRISTFLERSIAIQIGLKRDILILKKPKTMIMKQQQSAIKVYFLSIIKIVFPPFIWFDSIFVSPITFIGIYNLKW